MRVKENLIGFKTQKLTVIEEAPTHNKRIMWRCQCECGTILNVWAVSIKKGQKSCGCIKADIARVNGKKVLIHGHSSGGRMSKTYASWRNARGRCTNSDNKDSRNYIDRGIKMCDRWLSGENGQTGFQCFLEDMGEKPDGNLISLDRIDFNGDYEPANCRWATTSQQGRNKRVTKLDPKKVRQIKKLVRMGRLQEDIAEIYGISQATISDIIHRRTWKEINE